MDALEELGVRAFEESYEKRFDDDKRHTAVSLQVECPDAISATDLVRAVESVPGVRHVLVRRT